ncbi:MAG: ATP-binding protein [Litorilituus sp.]|jgi:serine/threonine-protein kinase RsbT|nr:ATP-binding protein [Litorilituus sp.]
MTSNKTSALKYAESILCELVIKKEWQISKARQELKKIALSQGYNSTSIVELVTSMSELAYNLFFHTNNGGEIKISVIKCDNGTGIKLACNDSGPGIISIEDALQDGYSTNGGLGGGLPGIKRLMDEFTIASNQHGTSITCLKWLI